MAKKPAELINVGQHRYTIRDLSMAAGAKKTVSVYLDPDAGVFRIKLPPDVAAILGGTTVVSSHELHQAKREFDRLIEKFEAETRSRAAKPMLVIWWAYNLPRDPEAPFNQIHRRGIGGTSIMDVEPDCALGLEYEVLHQIGNALFELNIDETKGEAYALPTHRWSLDSAKKHKRFIIPWTQEREAFIANMIESMKMLIERCDEFFAKGLIENMDKAIASGMGAMAMLPAADQNRDYSK